MVPQDQQLGVASAGALPGTINDDLDSAFAITKFWASAGPALFDTRYSISTPTSSRARALALHRPLRERAAAAAGFGRVRIHEHEALLHQGFLIIERHSVQIDERLRVDEDAHVTVLKYAVALARLRIEADVVAEPGAAAPLNAQAKAALLG